MKRLSMVVALAGATACSPPTAKEETPGKAGPGGERAAAGERFYGREKFTVVLTHTGRQTGTTTTHVRDWGRRRAELNDTTLSVSGVTQTIRNRVVYDGARAVTIDAATNAATATTNPLYDQVVESMRGRSGVEFGEQIMTRMGGRRTGEAGSFAGQACDYWEVAALSSRSCVTPWGATLYVRSGLGGIVVEQTATAVRMDDGGPDTAFAYDAANVTEGPNLGDVMARMKRN